jgi:transposase
MKPRGVLTNIKERTILDILPNRNKETVIKYLSLLPNKDNIQYVTMDMWQPYRDAVKTTLPQAQIIVDKFHVVRMANQALETIRKDTRSKLSAKSRKTLMHDRFILLKRKHELDERESLILETWICNFEEPGKAYVAKESFFELWDYPVLRVSPFTRYKAWESKLPEEIKYAFDPLLKGVGNWHEEIFAYFEHPITNAYTESINNLIRVINRIGRGYSFEALRAKLLFTESLHKEKKPKYSKNHFHGHELLEMIPGGLQTPYMLKKLNFGVDINGLAKKLVTDEFM